MIVADTSFIYALLDKRDRCHHRASIWYHAIDEAVCTTSLVVAEVDYLVSDRLGRDAVTAFYADISSGAYLIKGSQDLILESISVATKYDSIGLTDASLVAVAATFQTNTIATFDENHFRMIKPISRHSHFKIMPADN